MNQKSRGSNQSSSFCQKYFYSWLQPFVWASNQQLPKNSQRQVLEDIAGSVPAYYDSGKDYEAWRALWTGMRQRYNEIDNANDDLLKNSFIELFKDEFRTAFCLHFLGIQMNAFSPFLLYYLFLGIIQQNVGNILTMSIIVIATRLLRTLFNFVAENKLNILGQRIYSCIAQAMIDKSTRAALAAEKEQIMGTEMSKMMHLDIEKFLQFMLKKSNVTNNIISVLSNAFILIFLMSWAGFVGFMLLFVNFGLYAIIFKCAENNETMVAQSRDQRVRKTMQVFEMIKFVKIRALESFFYDKLVKLRDVELKSLGKIFAIELVPIFITMVSFKIIFMVVVLLVISSQQKFDSPIFFTAFLLLNNVFFIKVVLDVSFLKEASLAFGTIQNFLLCQEIDRSHIKHHRFSKPKEGDVVISIEGSFFWSKEERNQGEDEVRGAKVIVRHGELVTVVGPYASGKSSLLKAALGELHPRLGASIILNGSVAYVGQRPWIMNASVRDNVLFGESFVQVRYRWAVSGACLDSDFAILQNGDGTVIGERGCNLSGGQKVRIALARALYSGADVFLLDDILSAVDAHVAAAIFFDTLRVRLRGHTVLLVTHALTFLPHTDRIYIFESGAITAEGTFQAVKNHPTLKQIQNSRCKSIKEGKPQSKVQQISSALAIVDEPSDSHDSQDLSLYMQTNGGSSFLVLIVVFIIFNSGTHTVILFWMNEWANSKDYHNHMYMLIYVMLTLFAGSCGVAFVHYIYTRAHYRDLPARMIESLLLSPLEYFMAVPSAKIIRVLSSDQRINDRVLGQCLTRLFIYISAFLCNIIVILVVALLIHNFFFLGNQILFLTALTYICSQFLAAQRKYSELQHDVKLPLNNTFDETLDGISTIRAHCKQNYQISLFLQRLKRYCQCNTLASGISASTQFVTTLVYVLFFSISLALLFGAGNQVAFDCVMITSIFRGEEWIISTYAFIIEFLVNLKSLRRCNDLTRLEVEDGLSLSKIYNEDDPQAPHSYVHQISQLTPRPFAFASNSVEFRGFSARYRGRNANVLHKVSFKVAPGEKVGVVGRTGSGKSTLILSLMRAIGRTEGAILVGGVDVNSVPLSQLRAGIAVVMQEHFLFAGTVRQNVDPTEAFSDAAVQTALSQCGLWDSILHRGSLNAEVAQRGSNLSAGERQLLNLARSMLVPRSIVLMDEATAHVDAAADEAIQRAIRTAFAGSTVITVAHRISTVVDCDRILVLDGGCVAEFDSPRVLLSNPQSLFRKLCEETASTLNEANSPLKSSSNSHLPIRFTYK